MGCNCIKTFSKDFIFDAVDVQNNEKVTTNIIRSLTKSDKSNKNIRRVLIDPQTDIPQCFHNPLCS
jgi:hypothetical protein